MSTFEYNDLFLKAQEIGQYHVFTFDIIDSKKMDSIKRKEAQKKIIELIYLIYDSIKYLEVIKNQKILVFENDFIYGFPFNTEKPKFIFGYKYEPFLLSDVIGFTVYRDSISVNDVLLLFEDLKKQLDIDFDFHCANGYYETNNWNEAHEKYFRGHCIDMLSNLHKPYCAEISELLENNIKKI